jgi:CheY-like chemotaxis protein
MGLRISRTIIEAHGGRLWATDNYPRGASFHFTLGSPGMRGAWTPGATADLRREFGFAARAFSSAEEFLSSDCVDEAKCLILDIAMPGVSGLELYQELKRR